MRTGGIQARRLRVVLGYFIAVAAVYFTVRRLDLPLAALWPSARGLWRWELLAALALFTLHGAMNAVAFGYLLRSFAPASSVRESAAESGRSWVAASCCSATGCRTGACW